MKLKRVTAILLAGVMAMGLVACGSGSDTAADTTTSTSTATDTADDSESSDLLGSADATIHLKVGTTTAPDGHYVLGLVEMQKKLEEYSNGEMTLDIYPNSALGGESDMMDAVSMGTQDMPYLFETAEDAYKVLDGEIGQSLLDEFQGSGIKAIGFWENGFRELTNNTKEVATPADLAGMKIRTMENAVHMATYTALGATPTAMAWGEIFSALQQGTVDGQENPLAIILTAKVYEVQKYITMIDLFYSPCVLMINEDIYNNFTDEQKEAFDKAAEDGKVAERQISQELASSARATMEAEGVVFTDVNKDEWVAAVQSVYDDASLKIDQDLLAKIKAETAK